MSRTGASRKSPDPPKGLPVADRHSQHPLNCPCGTCRKGRRWSHTDQRSPPEDTMIKLAIKTTLAATAVIALAAPAAAQGAAPAGTPEAAEQQLGNVHFATSCNEVAQRRFDRAMRYQHSFWYRESQAIFEDALKADLQCAIALWGVALSMLNNPHAPPPTENLPRALAALQKAKEIGAKTPRERDFIDALLAFYTDSDKIDHRPTAHASNPISRRSRRWRSVIPTTTKRRSFTPSRSMSRRRPPTRPMPTSSKAPPSWTPSSRPRPSIP